MNDLHVITMYMHSPERLKHYHRFAKHMKDSGAVLHTVEVTPHDVLPSTVGGGLYLTTHSPEIWNKERAINIAIAKMLPSSAEFVAWLDADIIFCNPNWVGETIKRLKRWKVVQMFSHTQDLDPDWKPVGDVQKGHVYKRINGLLVRRGFEISGLGWGIRREALEKVRLLDWMISSGADTVMARAFLNDSYTVDVYPSAAYKRRIQEWIKTASQVVNGNVEYIPGLVLHCWHGDRTTRGYNEVENIMIEDKFDPDVDIASNPDGLYRFTGRNTKLEQDMNKWYRKREGL